MLVIRLHKVAMLFVGIFIFYIMWFKFAYSERSIILYGTAIATTACALCDLIISRVDVSKVFPWGVVMNLFMCVYSIITGILIARNYDILLSAAKTYVAFSLVCLAICYISYQENDMDWLINILITVDIIIAAYVLFRGSYRQGYGKILGPTQNPHTLGLAMNIGLFCTAYKASQNKGKQLLYYGLAVLFLYITIGCGSRKCLLVAALFLSMWLIPVVFRVWRQGSMLSKLFLLCLIVMVIFAFYYYYQRIYVNTDIYNRMERLGSVDERSSQLRIELYRNAIDYFQSYPVFGIGLDQFRVWNPYHLYAHSTYAEALADWGLVGCLFYFIPAIWAGVMLYKKAVFRADSNTTKAVFALFAMEVVLGVGQIWFYDFEHLIDWTIVFLFLKMNSEEQLQKEKQYRYVKA